MGSASRGRPTVGTLLLVVAVAAGGFAAGGRFRAPAGDTAPRTAGPAHGGGACGLVTEHEAARALGFGVEPSEIGASCVYTGRGPGEGLVSLSVRRGPQGVHPESFAAAMAAYAEDAGVPLRRILGVGDEAWFTFGDPTSEIVARSGAEFVTVSLIGHSSSPDHQAHTLSELLRIALPRMGEATSR